MTRKFSCRLTIQKNIEWIRRRKEQKCHSQHSQVRRRKFTEFVYFSFPAPECFSFNCVKLYSVQLLFMGLNGFSWHFHSTDMESDKLEMNAAKYFKFVKKINRNWFWKKRISLTHFAKEIIPLTISIMLAPT